MHGSDGNLQWPAKLSCPVLPKIIPRNRLLGQLKRAAGVAATWIAGPPGAGKTTLVASYAESSGLPLVWYQVTHDDADPATFFWYLAGAVERGAPCGTSRLPLLTPEYSLDREVFTRTFVEEMHRRLGHASRLFVFDNVQEMGEEAPLTWLLPTFLESVPSAWQVLFASRTAPPPAFARLLANRRLEVIDGPDLRFSTEESQQVAELLAPDTLEPASRDELIARADGWAAGLVLLVSSRVPSRRLVPADPGPIAEPDALFDYFATQVYADLSAERRAFLERLALLPVITAAGARSLTGEPQAGRLLADLAGRGYFTTRHRGKYDRYEFHPLFREFLRRQLDAGTGLEEQRSLLAAAAALAEAEDNFDTAVRYLARIEDWDGLTALLGRLGPSLMETGRHGTLERWFEGVPETVDPAYPWLRYWRGMAVTFTASELSRRRLREAFHAFEGNADARYRVATAINSLHFFSQNLAGAREWLDEICGFAKTQDPSGQSEPPAEFAASLAVLMYGAQPDRDEYPALEERLRRFVSMEANPPNLRVMFGSILGHSLTWGGAGWDTAKIALLERLHRIAVDEDIAPGPRFIWFAFAIQIWYWFDVLIGTEKDVTQMLTALDRAERQGVRILPVQHHSCYCHFHLAKGDLRALASRIDALRNSSLDANSHDRAFALYAEAWAAATEDNLTQALTLVRASANLAHQANAIAVLHIGFAEAQLLSLLGHRRDALRIIKRARRDGRRLRAQGLEFYWWLVAALVALERGQRARCARLTSGMFARMAREHYVRFPFLLRSPMSRLCAVALENGIEVEHVRRVIRASSLQAPDAVCGDWPWPVRIFCFGAMRIEIDGRPVSFGRKAPRRLLDLLGIIIASKGEAVPESKLIDELWTDREGDAAHNDLSVALHRLRRLLGNDALVVDNGLVTLNPRQVWTDVRAFLTLLGQAAETPTEEMEPSLDALARALALYRKPFLAGDDRGSWTVAAQWQFHQRYLGAVSAAGACHEREGRWQEALDLYMRALSIDPQSERLYQALFRCHAALGMRTEAAAAWERCKTAVGELGLAPSDKTAALYRAVGTRPFSPE